MNKKRVYDSSLIHIIELIKWALYHGLLNHWLLYHLLWLLHHWLLHNLWLWLWLCELCLLHHELLHLWCHHLWLYLWLHNLCLWLLSNTNWLYSLLLCNLWCFFYFILFFKLLDHIAFIPL